MASGKSLCIVILTLVLVCHGASLGQTPGQAERLFSPLVAGTFHKMAREAGTLGDAEVAAKAQVLLAAAARLDPRAEYLRADLLTSRARQGRPEDLEEVIRLFAQYTDKRSDFMVLRESVRYFMSTTDSRQGRQDLLLRLFDIVRPLNAALASEIIAEYAGLVAETANLDEAAKNYQQAWYYNKYNQRAFLRLDEILQKQGRGLSAADYATSLRLAMDVNPLDLENVLAFAEYCQRLSIYDVAAQTYEYAAELFAYLHPQDRLPQTICLPWMLACYNAPNMRAKCLDIAAKARQNGRFDLRVEALAGLAAKSLGNVELGQRTLDEAGRKAAGMLGSQAEAGDVTALLLGWFYAFANPSTEQALAWANRAFTSEPNRPDTRALFGYVLAMTEQYDLAVVFTENQDNQIALLTRGIVELSQETNKGIETLKQAVALDPTSLAAARARELLEAHGSEYLPAVSPQLVRDRLAKECGRIVPAFRRPEEIFSAKLNLGGSELSYGGDLTANLVITNESSQPLIISDDGILAGRIRVDANVRGDLNEHIKALIDTRVMPSMPVAAGEYTSIPLDLMTGRLRKLLLSFPQASVDVEFIVYLDPVIEPSGRVNNAIKDLPPVRSTVKRHGVALTRDYLMQRLDALARGQEGQKIRAAELFAGLLIEQDYMAVAGPAYRYIRVDRPILADAVKRCLVDENWKVRIETMEALTLAGKVDYELTRVLSSNLNDDRWPVRMMAMVLLSKVQGKEFAQVLSWAAEYDSEDLVRRMAVALAGEPKKG